MKLTLYQIDAFAEKVFSGNPAAVCILEEWLEDDLMQNIAAENNLAETAFAVRKDDVYLIRWFTPLTEVDLCGHATLATAFVLYQYYQVNSPVIKFYSPRSGYLAVENVEDYLILDFPTDELSEIETPQVLCDAFQAVPLKTLKGKTDFLLVYPDEAAIKAIVPDLQKVAAAGERGVIVTAPGNEVDFVSRFFAPQVGVNEDPVTGSAHTTLTPYWADRLGKKKLYARQLSTRGGNLRCELAGERVKIAGKAVPYMVAEIDV